MDKNKNFEKKDIIMLLNSILITCLFDYIIFNTYYMILFYSLFSLVMIFIIIFILILLNIIDALNPKDQTEKLTPHILFGTLLSLLFWFNPIQVLSIISIFFISIIIQNFILDLLKLLL